MSLFMFKTKLVRIVSNILNSTSKFGIETISAYPLQGYHTEKKPYIRVRTWNQYDRNNALKAVRAIGMCTALDDLNCQYYYRKVAREERLPLSSWATLSNYSYILSENSYLFRVFVGNYNSISDDEYNNPLISSTLTKDRTLVLTWDMETYSSLGLGNFPTAKDDTAIISPNPQYCGFLNRIAHSNLQFRNSNHVIRVTYKIANYRSEERRVGKEC